MNTSLDLYPLHLEDLRKSGLSDETITQAGIKSIPLANIRRELGFEPQGVESCYRIPYPGCDGFYRYRMFYDGSSRKNGDKEPAKYLQRKDSGNRLCIPDGTEVEDTNVPLYVVEGEK